MFPDKIYYEEATMGYELGHYLKQKYQDRTWIPIDSHNKIDELRTRPNSDFREMKQYLIIGIRKTHRHVPNAKVSDFLVPYTSSGCIAACLYCYLVCNYNKCSYLRLFVNREEMLDKIMKSANRSLENLTFEIGSNSDLVLENTITHNLEWTIERFVKNEKGSLTFPTKCKYRSSSSPPARRQDHFPYERKPGKNHPPNRAGHLAAEQTNRGSESNVRGGLSLRYPHCPCYFPSRLAGSVP